jgi:branched-chain amino acid transport system substrate-binding protein
MSEIYRPNRRQFIVGGSAIGAGLLLLGCGNDDSGSPTTTGAGPGTTGAPGTTAAPSGGFLTGQTLRIGVLLGFTGVGGPYATQIDNALKIAVADLEARSGAKVELLIRDHQSTPERVPGIMAEFADAGVVAAIGSGGSPWTIPAAQAADELEIPLIVPIELAQEIIGAGREFVFRLEGGIGNLARQAVTFLDSVGTSTGRYPQRMAVVTNESVLGEGAAKVYLEEIAKYPGMELIERITFDEETTSDLLPVATRLKQANIEAVCFFANPKGAILHTEAMALADFLPFGNIGSLGGSANQEFLSSLGALAEHDLCANQWTPNMKAPGGGTGARDLFDRYLADNSAKMDSAGATYYSALGLVAHAVTQAESLDPIKVRDSVRAAEFGPEADTFSMYVMPHGIKFAPTGDNTDTGGVVTQIKGGEFTAVWPDELGVAQPTWPRPAW